MLSKDSDAEVLVSLHLNFSMQALKPSNTLSVQLASKIGMTWIAMSADLPCIGILSSFLNLEISSWPSQKW